MVNEPNSFSFSQFESPIAKNMIQNGHKGIIKQEEIQSFYIDEQIISF